ncbi:MAG: aspartate dehydrogenase [Thermoplasmatota archaeon]
MRSPEEGVNLNIGIIGCGFIGTTIAGAVNLKEEVVSINLIDLDFENAVELSSKLSKGTAYAMDDLEVFLEASDLVIESASQNAVSDLMPGAVEKGKDIMILSVGALVDDDLWNSLKKSAKEHGSRIFIPSGAVSGIDGILSGSMAGIDCVTLTVRKPPGGLSLPSSMRELAGKMKNLNEPLLLFEGTAREAVKMFPKNVNVAATIALAGVGFDRTSVKIIADPAVHRNQQRIEVRGRFGEMRLEMMNQPSTTNPRTSYLAPLSAIAVIEKLISGINIGN